MHNSTICVFFSVTYLLHVSAFSLSSAFVEHVWNMMAHAQKPDLVFQRNGRVHLNRWGDHFSQLLAAEVCASAVVMVVMLDTPCSEAECKTTGYPLHSPVSPSLPLPCVTVCHQVSIELYFPPTWSDVATLEGSSCTHIMTCTGGCGYSF